MVKIIPALIDHDPSHLEAQIRAAEPYFSEAQVDFMDGIFVPTKSLTDKEARLVPTSLKLQAHLMVQDPVTWIEDLCAAKFKTMIIHQEIGVGLVSALGLIKNLGLAAGLAINPDSELDVGRDYWGQLELIQLMGVYPGHYGATFQPQVVDKIRLLREMGFNGLIQVDGGVTPQTAPLLARSGAGSLVVGGWLFGSEDNPNPGKIGEKLTELRTALGTP